MGAGIVTIAGSEPLVPLCYQWLRLSSTQATYNGSLPLPASSLRDAARARRVIEFFTANIRNPHTRKAYAKAASEIATWCEDRGLAHFRDVQPVHVAAYVEGLQLRIAAPSVKKSNVENRFLKNPVPGLTGC